MAVTVATDPETAVTPPALVTAHPLLPSLEQFLPVSAVPCLPVMAVPFQAAQVKGIYGNLDI